MMGDVIEISPSPELEPRTVYRPLRRKRDTISPLDGNESAIELTDSTDSQSSSPCKRARRRKEAAKPSAGPSTPSINPVVRPRALSPRVSRTHKLRGQTPASASASRKTAAEPRKVTPVQEPRADSPSVAMHIQEHGATQTELLAPLTAPGSPQLPNHQLTPQLEDGAPAHELPPSITPSASEVAPESHERLVERVREVVPDVLPAHVFKLLAIHETAFPDNLLDIVIDTLLEDRSYPKDIKGKAKARAVEEETAENSGDIGTSADYMQLDSNRRLGAAYRVLCLRYLRSNFPTLDDMHILEILSLHSGRYAPAYIYLLQQGAIPTSALPIAPTPGKRKRKGGKKKSSLDEEEFLREHTWLIQKLENHQNSPVMASTTQDDAKEEGDGIECGCCFSSYPFSQMAQCTDTHLFCTSCVTSYASAKLGEQSSDFRCMDISGCKMTFPDSELRRVLPEKLFALYEHIRQRREIEQADIEGLEECPFCDYKVVMDADFETDKVLTCQKEECGRVSCRKCKQENHLPKSCEEVGEDKLLGGKHAIEEAMTRALMRNCPKCQKAFVKEYGCNKMTCTYCGTVSCYVCRSIIKGYDHFDQSRSGAAQRPGSSSKKCPLWDAVEDRHAKEVAAAAEKALKEYKTLHPDVQDEDIRVELPPAPPPDVGKGPRFHPLPPYVQVHHAHNAHVPIAHPVMALPYPPLPAPPINPEDPFAHDPPYFGQLVRPPLPRQDAPVMFPMPPPAPYNPLQAPAFPMPPLPRPPLQWLPPMEMLAMPGPRRAGRGRRRG